MISMKFKNILRIILYPIVICRRCIIRHIHSYLAIHDPQKLAAILYKSVMGIDMDWESPRDLNAKIQWLKFNGNKELWAECADKYRVRKYVEDRGCSDLLVPLYGVWESANEINWDALPAQFIMKVNNDSGGIVVCDDKSKLNVDEVKNQFTRLLSKRFSDKYVEPHYSLIPPRIIAEQLLNVNDQDIKSTSLIDYKVWCFDGIPLYIRVYHNRIGDTVQTACFNVKWELRNDIIVYGNEFQESLVEIPKPRCFDRMIEAASILSKGHPQVRVDFYSVGGKCYFGEMTFTSLGGYMNSFTKDALLEMGDMTNLNIKI